MVNMAFGRLSARWKGQMCAPRPRAPSRSRKGKKHSEFSEAQTGLVRGLGVGIGLGFEAYLGVRSDQEEKPEHSWKGKEWLG